MDENLLGTFKRAIESIQVLRRYDKTLLDSTLSSLDLAENSMISIGIAGAQGVGKTTLLKAILASKALPDPPFPARQREETGVPVLAARAEKPYLVEIYGKRKRKRIDLKKITQNDIHIRTSADKLTERHADYLRLKSLEVFMPDLAIPEGVFIVDLPGVGGNLATVSKWAQKYVLEGMSCILFVLDCAQAVTCVESEANLIRMFGPQLYGSIFIQNVWSDYDDDVESVEKANREFLSEHIGEHTYVKIDLKQALQEKSSDNQKRLAAVQKFISSVGAGRDAVIIGSASRTLKIRGLEIRSALEVELRRLSDQKEQYLEERKTAETQLKELENAKQSLMNALEESAKQQEVNVKKGVRVASEEFLIAMQKYIEESESINKKLLERKLAREIGFINKRTSIVVTEAIRKVQEDIGDTIQDYQQAADNFAKAETPDIDGNLIVILLRRGLHIGAGIGGGFGGFVGGAALGAKVGGFVGTIAGPLGAIVGGFLGAALGGLLARVFTSENKKRRKCLENLQSQVKTGLPDWIEGALLSYRTVMMRTRSALEKDFQLRTKKVIIPPRLIGAEGVDSVREDIERLNSELEILDRFIGQTWNSGA